MATARCVRRASVRMGSGGRQRRHRALEGSGLCGDGPSGSLATVGPKNAAFAHGRMNGARAFPEGWKLCSFDGRRMDMETGSVWLR